MAANANGHTFDGNTSYTKVENWAWNEAFIWVFFRAGKLMFSSTKTTPPTATRPRGKRQDRIAALKTLTHL